MPFAAAAHCRVNILADAVAHGELLPDPNRPSSRESCASTAELTFSATAALSDAGAADRPAGAPAEGVTSTVESGAVLPPEPPHPASSAATAVTAQVVDHSRIRFTRSTPTSDIERVTIACARAGSVHGVAAAAPSAVSDRPRRISQGNGGPSG
ncbi:hypothetical protein GCM10010331_23940 [Streptomyces xanthochromogenes]|nr:hypothetical protein GCM10010331_23940 [Streptomyces xanthochromogenes]